MKRPSELTSVQNSYATAWPIIMEFSSQTATEGGGHAVHFLKKPADTGMLMKILTKLLHTAKEWQPRLVSRFLCRSVFFYTGKVAALTYLLDIHYLNLLHARKTMPGITLKLILRLVPKI